MGNEPLYLQPPPWVMRHIAINGYAPQTWIMVEEFRKQSRDPNELVGKVKTIRIPGRPLIEYMIEGSTCTWRQVE